MEGKDSPDSLLNFGSVLKYTRRFEILGLFREVYLGLLSIFISYSYRNDRIKIFLWY